MEHPSLKSITQAEFNQRLSEWLLTIPGPINDSYPNWEARWYTENMLKFSKDLEKDGFTVRAGFHVDNTGQVIKENDK